MPHQKPKVRLWAAAQAHDRAAALAALRLGAPVNALNDQGWSALMWASQAYGALAGPLVQALLGAGADPNLPGQAVPPLSLLARQSQQERAVVEALLAAGADPNARDDRGDRPLATLLQRHAELTAPSAWARQVLEAGLFTVHRLLDAGAVLHDLNAAGEDAMTLAVRHRYADRDGIAAWQIGREQQALRAAAGSPSTLSTDSPCRSRARL